MNNFPSGEFDVFLAGTLFVDIVFTGLSSAPVPGKEIQTSGMGMSPGGIANLAVAASRLGLRTGLATGFGDDAYGIWSRQILGSDEGIDLTRSRDFPGWHSPVTVSMAYEGDRAMVTHSHPEPAPIAELVAQPPIAKVVVASLSVEDADPWWRTLQRAGSQIFADVGWDETERWDPAVLDQLDGCFCVMPNADEAMAYTRTDSPEVAVRALAQRVPLAVVTCGADGSIGIDSSTGELVRVPAIPVDAIDPTGAGDDFGAGLVLGTLRGWPLKNRLQFAALCAGLSVREVGGALAAPGWGDVLDWRDMIATRAGEGDKEATRLHEEYAFLTGEIPSDCRRVTRRANATIAQLSDA